MIFELLLTAVFLVALFSVAKVVLWSGIKEIIRLNKEAALGNPEPEKLVRIYHASLKKFSILIIFLLGVLALMKKLGIGNQ